MVLVVRSVSFFIKSFLSITPSIRDSKRTSLQIRFGLKISEKPMRNDAIEGAKSLVRERKGQEEGGGRTRIEIPSSTGKVLVGIYPATLCGVDNPTRPDFGAVALDRKDGGGTD